MMKWNDFLQHSQPKKEYSPYTKIKSQSSHTPAK